MVRPPILVFISIGNPAKISTRRVQIIPKSFYYSRKIRGWELKYYEINSEIKSQKTVPLRDIKEWNEVERLH
jgi:hypothetical protein